MVRFITRRQSKKQELRHAWVVRTAFLVLPVCMMINFILLWNLLLSTTHHAPALSSSRQLAISTTAAKQQQEQETDRQDFKFQRREPEPPRLSSSHDDHATTLPLMNESDWFLYDVPSNVPPQQHWRYRSNDIFWTNTTDPLYWNFHKQLMKLRLRMNDNGAVVPVEVSTHQANISNTLKKARLHHLATLWNNAYPYTLTQTTFPLFDGTTYVITGDIPLLWIRDSCAQVHPYLELLDRSAVLEALVEGLLRRQSLFLLNDPYGTSFRLFLDFDFANKIRLTDWDIKSGRTIHVAMHNYELDNLAYFLRLSYELFKHYERTNARLYRALDDTWLKAFDAILDTVEREQQHYNTSSSQYVYPELPNQGKGSKVCHGGGLTWSGFRPSDDQTKYGYLIPANMMMVVSLRNAARMIRGMLGNNDTRATRAERLANELDDGIHTHGVVVDKEFGKIYAYEVDGCGNVNTMDDANIPSLLSIPYLNYTSLHDPQRVIQTNTRRFVLSRRNQYYFASKNGTNKGIGSPHTRRGNVWHLSLIMQALTTQDDAELLELLHTLQRTASNDLMHESFDVNRPSVFTRKSFAWANSLFAELISTRLEDIVRVLTNTNGTKMEGGDAKEAPVSMSGKKNDKAKEAQVMTSGKKDDMAKEAPHVRSKGYVIERVMMSGKKRDVKVTRVMSGNKREAPKARTAEE